MLLAIIDTHILTRLRNPIINIIIPMLAMNTCSKGLIKKPQNSKTKLQPKSFEVRKNIFYKKACQCIESAMCKKYEGAGKIFEYKIRLSETRIACSQYPLSAVDNLLSVN